MLLAKPGPNPGQPRAVAGVVITGTLPAASKPPGISSLTNVRCGWENNRAAPHYTAPRLDGGRPGTFWFNTLRPTAGTGWDIEAVAFHEAVPGHHLQLSRLQLMKDLPDLRLADHAPDARRQRKFP